MSELRSRICIAIPVAKEPNNYDSPGHTYVYSLYNSIIMNSGILDWHDTLDGPINLAHVHCKVLVLYTSTGGLKGGHHQKNRLKFLFYKEQKDRRKGRGEIVICFALLFLVIIHLL